MPVMNPAMSPASKLPVQGVFAFMGSYTDPHAELWAGAVRSNGGSVSDDRLALVSAFIVEEKAIGAWALTDDYWALWGETSVQSLVSLKQRRLATVSGSPTFAANTGYTFSGTNYIDTGFIPSSHAVNLAATNGRLATYDRTNVAASNTVITAGAVDLTIVTRSSTGLMRGAVCSATFNVTGSEASDRRGLNVLSRTGTTTAVAYRRGAASGSGGTVASTLSLPSVSLFIGGGNNAGSITGGFAGSVGMFAVGAPLSAAQEAAHYANVQAWATTVGANV